MVKLSSSGILGGILSAGASLILIDFTYGFEHCHPKDAVAHDDDDDDDDDDTDDAGAATFGWWARLQVAWTATTCNQGFMITQLGITERRGQGKAKVC
jgi:hypothetical protein